MNYRLTGFEEYFMTVKVLNLTLGSSIETFQIHAGRLIAVGTKKVFSCLPKGGVNTYRVLQFAFLFFGRVSGLQFILLLFPRFCGNWI